jgi:hypothetical protein
LNGFFDSDGCPTPRSGIRAVAQGASPATALGSISGTRQAAKQGRASDAAAPAGLEYTCTRTPSACALGYVLAPLRGLGQPSEFKICRSVKYANSRTQRTAAPACKDCRRRHVSNDSAGTYFHSGGKNGNALLFRLRSKKEPAQREPYPGGNSHPQYWDSGSSDPNYCK